MLRLNRFRKLIKSGIFFIFAAAIFLFIPEYSPAQQKTITAFLESGPSALSGMPGLGVNVLKGWKGIYQLPAGSGTAEKVTVYFSKTSVPVFESWSEVKTASNTIFKAGQKNLFIYRYLENWTLFIEFNNDDIPPGALFFTDALIQQMIFFVRDGSNFVNSSFPAVIEYKP